MGATCFMVEHTMDCWADDGSGPRVGAMVWRRHQLEPYDTVAPRPLPHLGVMTSAGLVCLDCPDSDPPHGYWTRKGDPPAVSVIPSLNVNPGGTPTWHGYLTDGVLTP